MMLHPVHGVAGRLWPKIFPALQGTAATLAALLAAVILEVENPYWAAMTALIVIQPTRGLLFEKSFYRLVGTVAGSAAGLLLLLHTTSPPILTLVLALWIAACVGSGWPTSNSAATTAGISGTESGGNLLPGIWMELPPGCQLRRSGRTRGP